ncbi:hypothetical protein H5410_012109, partial [Solanum commersonii]
SNFLKSKYEATTMFIFSIVKSLGCTQPQYQSRSGFSSLSITPSLNSPTPIHILATHIAAATPLLTPSATTFVSRRAITNPDPV